MLDRALILDGWRTHFQTSGPLCPPQNVGPISLASCFFKLLEHLVHSGFRWGADLFEGSLVSILSPHSSSHIFVAFIDMQTSWVQGTLVRLFGAGVHARMWKVLCHFLRGVRGSLGFLFVSPLGSLKHAQGRVLSPLLFNTGLVAVLFLSTLSWSAVVQNI